MRILGPDSVAALAQDRDRPASSGREAISLVSAIDRHYVVPWSAMIVSFRDHNPGLLATAYILHYDLTDDDLAYLKQVAEKASVELIVLRIPTFPFALFHTRGRSSLSQRRTMSPIAYVKAFVDRFLPETVSRAVLIDADIIIAGPMSELARMPLPRPVAAVANIPRNHHHQFNSGLALIDLAAWRRLRVSDIAERFLLAYSDALHSHDQHTLNLIFGGDWLRLGLKWNYMEDHYRYRERNTAFDQSEILSARANPVVIHYAVGDDKPWKNDSRHPRADVYRKYRESLRPLEAGINLVEPV